jgi:hypothetical protein
MAKDKASFVLYSDLIHTVDKLSDARAGRLLKIILHYVNDKNPEDPKDQIISIAFEPIKQQLKRDFKKWEKYIHKQKENGKKGGRPLKNKELKTQKTQAFFEKPKKADSVSVNVSDSVSVIDKSILNDHDCEKTIEYCLITMQRNYDTNRIRELWKAFLIQNEHEIYSAKPKQLKHFQNWLKNKSDDGKQKPGTSEARILALKNF